MSINPVVAYSIQNIGKNMCFANPNRNYCTFDEQRVSQIVNEGENALGQIEEKLKTANCEAVVLESLYILNRMLDNNVKGIDKLYPTLSRFNNTNSPNIQVMLSGIYRKTLVPDAYGPLNRMMIRQILYPNSPHFDPTEEIGGAILEYIRAYSSKELYK